MLATLLRRRGHDAVSARLIGRERGDDAEHLLIAAQQQRILVTHDRDDFTLLHRAWMLWSAAWQVAATHAGIRVIPQPPRLSVVQSEHEIVLLFSPQRDFTGSHFAWTASAGWTLIT